MIIHEQKIVCYCHICKKRIEIDSIDIIDGSPFLKVSRKQLTSNGWVVVGFCGREAFICEKHKDFTDKFISELEHKISFENTN